MNVQPMVSRRSAAGERRHLSLVACVVALSLLAPGCVVVRSKSVEKVARHDRAVRLAGTPAIDLVFQPEDLRENLAKIKHEFPFLEKAEEGNAEADLVLIVERTTSETWWPRDEEVCGLVFWLLAPCYGSTVRDYQMTWSRRDDSVLHRHTGQLRERFAIHLFLVYALPVNLVTVLPAKNPEQKMLRRLLRLIERDLAKEEVSFHVTSESDAQG